jgi:signal transduction histidine kinase
MMNLDMLDECASVLPPSGRDALARVQALAGQALEQVRAVSHSLHPPDWQGLSIGDALRHLIGSSGISGRFEVFTDFQPLSEEPSQTVKVVIYRCVQECISNFIKHSGATRLSLTLQEKGAGIVELRVEDNGRGFQSEQSDAEGIGLLAIREHTEALDGQCDISGSPGGVSVRIRLPLLAE